MQLKFVAQKAHLLKESIPHTIAAYADMTISAGLNIVKAGYNTYDKITHHKNTHFESNWDKIKTYTPGYNLRERIREKYDTVPTLEYLLSNAGASGAFFLTGTVAAEATRKGLEYVFGTNIDEHTKNQLNSIATLTTQYAITNTAFIALQVKQNKKNYINEKGKLSTKKILIELGKYFSAGIFFDVPYTLSKTIVQTNSLDEGMAAWQSSADFDIYVGMPAWYSMAIPLGIMFKLINPKHAIKKDHIKR